MSCFPVRTETKRAFSMTNTDKALHKYTTFIIITSALLIPAIMKIWKAVRYLGISRVARVTWPLTSMDLVIWNGSLWCLLHRSNLSRERKRGGERCETCCSGFDGDVKHLGKTIVFLYAHLCFIGDQSRTWGNQNIMCTTLWQKAQSIPKRKQEKATTK